MTHEAVELAGRRVQLGRGRGVFRKPVQGGPGAQPEGGGSPRPAGGVEAEGQECVAVQ